MNIPVHTIHTKYKTAAPCVFVLHQCIRCIYSVYTMYIHDIYMCIQLITDLYLYIPFFRVSWHSSPALAALRWLGWQRARRTRWRWFWYSRERVHLLNQDGTARDRCKDSDRVSQWYDIGCIYLWYTCHIPCICYVYHTNLECIYNFLDRIYTVYVMYIIRIFCVHTNDIPKLNMEILHAGQGRATSLAPHTVSFKHLYDIDGLQCS
jgi:hypothetical protein